MGAATGYDNDKDLKVCFLVTHVVCLKTENSDFLINLLTMRKNTDGEAVKIAVIHLVCIVRHCFYYFSVR